MRILAMAAFSFALGLLPVVLGASPLLAVILLIIPISLFFFLQKRRVKHRDHFRVLLIGFALGLVYSSCFYLLFICPVEQVREEANRYAVELTEYPVVKGKKATAEGEILRSGKRRSVTVTFPASEAALQPGDILVGEGVLSANTQAEDSFYKSSGLFLSLQMESAAAAGSNPQTFRYFPQQLAQRLKNTIHSLFPKDVSAFLQALLTGDRSELSYLQKTQLQIAGVFHVLAVSGMHVAILLSAVYVLSLHNRWLYPAIGIPVLIVYVLLTGAPASVIRAAVMQLFLMSGSLLGRESDGPTSLGAALLLLTLQNPYCLLNTGFQASFLATLGIILLGSNLSKRFLSVLPKKKFLRGISRFLAASLAQSIAALLFTLPIMLLQFEMVSLVGILVNLLIIQVVTWSFTLGLFACIAGMVLPILGQIIAFPVIWLLRYVIAIVSFGAELPYAALYMQNRYLLIWFLAAYPLLVCFVVVPQLLSFKKRLLCAGAAIAVFVLCMKLPLLEQMCFKYTVRFLDVGQGQCILLESGGKTMAIDCGGSRYDGAGELLTRTVYSDGYRRLDYLLLTHYDTDHTGGAQQLLARIDTSYLILPDVPDDTGNRSKLELAAAEHGTKVLYLREDAVSPFGNGTLQLFAPLSAEGGNASCISVLAEFEDLRLLVTGDLSATEESKLIHEKTIPQVDILVAGHHGSETSTSLELLNTVRPNTIIISVGENLYGHPNPNMLLRAKLLGAAVYRTDECGTITVRR